ncbi:DMT family transporter [Brevibacillus humidisoli]|uniref:EamA family transporter n=1 Tax=Brevibacillus humidisoli TaxID=2895522 RepID=UPI001E41A577|nr:DMT family transporter [Brevibacillus humidisoli]
MTALVFAINNIVVKQGFKQSDGKDNGFFTTVLINVVVLGLFFVAAAAWKGWELRFSWTGLWYFVLAGLFTTGLGRLTLFSSIHRIGPSKASAIRNSTPVFTMLFALLVLGEAITLLPGLGIGMLLAAIFLQGFVLYRGSASGKLQAGKSSEKSAGRLTDQSAEKTAGQSADQLAERNKRWAGFLLALLSAAIFGAGQGVRKQGLLEMNDAFLGAWVGALTSLVFALIYQGWRGELKVALRRTFSQWNPYYLIAGVMTSLGPLFFFLAATSLQVTYVSVIAAVEPILTVLLSMLFLKGEETHTLSIWITAALILAGTVLIALFA